MLKDDFVVIPNTNIRVSRICFGGCPMGGYGWGKSKEEDFIIAVQSALDNGINFFDTADIYGLGQSEITLGKALGSRRKEAVIATKFGCRRKDGKTYYDNSPEWIREALDNSLKRLQTDYIDLYQMHYRDSVTPISDIVKTLEALKKEGKIRAYGLCNLTKKDLNEIESFPQCFSTLQDEYSLATRKNESFLNLYRNQLGIIPLTWGSLGQGILTGTIDENTVFDEGDRRLRPEYVNFHGDKFKHNLMIVEELKKLSSKYNKSVASIAIRFILDNIKDSVVLVGIMNKSELLANIEALNWHLSTDDLEKLDRVSQWK
ncbi:MAG: aldo/keto reductase [Mollicutes bacterium]|nr:aldo/keto reductase [Mollicutes bacterium]